MTTVFISYRRDDSEAVTRSLYEELASRFGRDSVFMDVDTIPLGVDFHEHLQTALGQCDVLLAMIGDKWLGAVVTEGPKKGLRRLDDPDDFVRLEIEAALRRDIPVVPVLVQDATMPRKDELPESLVGLAKRQAARVRLEPHLYRDVARIMRQIEKVTASAQPQNSGAPKQHGSKVGCTLAVTIGMVLVLLAYRPGYWTFRTSPMVTSPTSPMVTSPRKVQAAFELSSDRKQYTSAARDYQRLLAHPGPEANLANDLYWLIERRCRAADAALFAAAGVGGDTGSLNQEERNELRKHALEWLLGEPDALAAALDPKEREEVTASWRRAVSGRRTATDWTLATASTLDNWQAAPELAHVREKAALAALPSDERTAWGEFWRRVEELRKQAEQ